MTLRVLLIGDVGGDTYHMGDEAMFDTAVTELVRRGDVELFAVTTDRRTIEERYGVASVPLIDFDARRGPAFDDARHARLRDVLDGTCTGVHEWRAAVDSADAVLVCGGGNLSSSWPHLTLERVALLAAAQRRGIPTVLVGQTMGPYLTEQQRAALAPVLADASFVGVRDADSLVLARSLAPHAEVLHHADDTIAMPIVDPPAGLPPRFAALAVHHIGLPSDDVVIDAMAHLARDITASTGLPVVLLPNTGGLDGQHEPGTDAHLAVAVSKALGDPAWVTVAPVLRRAATPRRWPPPTSS